MKYELEEIKKGFKFEYQAVEGGKFRVIGITKLNSLIVKINKFGFIDNEYKEFITNFKNIVTLFDNEVILNSIKYEQYEELLSTINLKVTAVITAISLAIDNQDENSISIKLPPFTDLKSVANFIEDIEKIFKGVLPDKKQGELKLSTFDTGSNWIEVVMTYAESVVIIGEFVKITTELAKNILALRSTTEKLESTNSIDDEARQIVLDSMRKLEVEQSKISASKLLESGVINTEDLSNINEYQNGLSMQILTMADYLIKGAEVKPALNAPEEQKEEFPSNEEYKLLQESANQLLLNSPSEDQKTEN
ncbi:hypothetical protein ACIQXF_06560, partial [Lysinibacillus sp. NPDC097231]|uniref:hypothetical protein n=1 Tax=Lysinibacillus sp. NPDC097231 TaxID=3364142 RepID=UPI00381F81FD